MSDLTLEFAPEALLTFSCEAVKELHSTINYMNAFNLASLNIPAELNTLNPQIMHHWQTNQAQFFLQSNLKTHEVTWISSFRCRKCPFVLHRKMYSLSTLLVIILFALKIHTVQPGKCPKFCICDNIQLTVACVNKNLTEVPPTIDEVICATPWSLVPYFWCISVKWFTLFFSKITVKLDLRGNDLQELPTGAFTHTPYLTHLSLQNSNIQRVREGAFRRLSRLVLLNLANNKIEILYQVRHDVLVFVAVTWTISACISSFSLLTI